MATINGMTAEAMAAIRDGSITGAAIVGDDLVLTHFDGSTTTVGNVRGPIGIPGVSNADLAALFAAYDPPGIAKPYELPTLPAGHGWCDAQTEFDAATYPVLAAEYGTGGACINGTSAAGKFRLPDYRGKLPVGRHTGITAFNTLHATGGSKDAVVVTHHHTHDHGGAQNGGVNHGHSNAGGHSHTVDGGDGGDRIAISYGSGDRLYSGGTAQSIQFTSLEAAGDHNHGGADAINHTHPINADNTDSGVSGTDKNLPPYRVVNYIMRLA